MQNENPPVTVVLACYNHEKYIRQSIESVINQTYKNISFYVIDDGSKDKSFEIIEELSKKHGFVAIRQENKGLCATINHAVKEYGHGKYISFLASDDYWRADKIEKQVRFFEESNNKDLMMCCAMAYEVNDQNEIIKNIGKLKDGERITFDKLLLYNRIIAVTVMLRLDVYKNVGYYDESLKIEDWDMWLRIADKYEIGYLDDCLSYYRVHELNSTNPAGNLKLLTDKITIANKWKSSPFYSRSIRNIKLSEIDNYINANDKKMALRKWASNIKYLLSLAYWKYLIKIIVR
jgi:alpha-1,3-rhamnosyltransferase